MSAKKNSRPSSREALMKMLFQMEVQGEFSEAAMERFFEDFVEEDLDKEYIESGFKALKANLEAIDETIAKFSKGWKIERMAKVDLSVLRLCITEMKYFPDAGVPESVAISEAVRIAKLYGDANSGRFVNGILGGISKDDKNA